MKGFLTKRKILFMGASFYLRLSNPIFFLLLLIFLTSCQVFKLNKKNVPYSFFVAGHAYGSPQEEITPGLYPPFVADFDSIKAISNMAFGVLTGDIVYYSRDSFWDKVDQELNYLDMPIYFAAGNHDEGHKPVYQERYGKTFYAFTQGQDLFLVLNPGLAGWNIWKDQYTFLETQLEQAADYQHIFVFFHQLLWSEASIAHPPLKPNSFDGRAPTINFWPQIMPLFYATKRPVYLFSGDVGANLRVTSFSMQKSENVYMLASGMGNGVKDNYLLVDVDENNDVRLSIRWIGEQKTERLDKDEEIHLVYPY